jgi:uncharacterized membrane protein YjdF
MPNIEGRSGQFIGCRSKVNWRHWLEDWDRPYLKEIRAHLLNNFNTVLHSVTGIYAGVSKHMYVCQSVCVCLCLSVCLSVCLPVSIKISRLLIGWWEGNCFKMKEKTCFLQPTPFKNEFYQKSTSKGFVCSDSIHL